MFQKQEKMLILSGGDVSLIAEKFRINQLMGSLAHHLNKAVKNFDSSQKDISSKTEFPLEIFQRTFVCLDVQEPKIATHFKHEIQGYCV